MRATPPKLAVAFALLVAFAVQLLPRPASIVVPPAPRFDDSMFPKKTDRVRQIEIAQPKPVPVERIVPAPDTMASAPPVPMVPREEPPPLQPVSRSARYIPATTGDICTRHRMHKVWTRDGKSWRCRR